MNDLNIIYNYFFRRLSIYQKIVLFIYFYFKNSYLLDFNIVKIFLNVIFNII